MQEERKDENKMQVIERTDLKEKEKRQGNGKRFKVGRKKSWDNGVVGGMAQV